MATHDATLTALAETYGGDLLLIDAGSNIVYSADKRIDIGTNLVDGPHAGSDLAALVTEELDRVRAGDALVTDFSVYVPGGARPVLFAAAVIRAGNEIVGTLAVEIPVAAIDAITSGGATTDRTGTRRGRQLHRVRHPRAPEHAAVMGRRPGGLPGRHRGSPTSGASPRPSVHRWASDHRHGTRSRRTRWRHRSREVDQCRWSEDLQLVDVDRRARRLVGGRDRGPVVGCSRPLVDFLIRMGIVAAVLLPLRPCRIRSSLDG